MWNCHPGRLLVVDCVPWHGPGRTEGVMFAYEGGAAALLG